MGDTEAPDLSGPGFEETEPRRPNIPGVDLTVPLGRGAFGDVWRGHHRALDVDVAVKLVSSSLADPAALDRALREARLMARLDHPNLVRIHDAGRAGGTLYMVLELMDGGSLAKVRRAPMARLTDVARQLASGLQALHDARILHRDIKPANCLTRSDGRIKLADLGIAVDGATRTSPHEFGGTLPFMAPELFEHPPRWSPRSDLYALGLTLLCLALDEDPFPRGAMSELMAWIAGGQRPRLATLRPDLSPSLSQTVARLLAARPEDRPESAAELLTLLAGGDERAPVVAPVADAPAIGPWRLGAEVYTSSNWRGFAVTHVRTGAAARLNHLQTDSGLRTAANVILASAARAAELDHPGLLAVIDWGLAAGTTDAAPVVIKEWTLAPADFDSEAGEAALQSVLEAARAGARPYVVNPPQGRTLLDLVASGGPLDEADALELAIGIAEALAYLHQRDLVYQLLVPTSAFIARDGRSVQLGWPIFCVPAGSPAFTSDGTPQRAFFAQHAPPEAFSHHGAIEPSADLYGLGEVLFFLLTGHDAFHGATAMECALSKAEPAPDVAALVPTITRPTASLVASLLAADPALRPPSAAATRERLDRILRRLRGS